MEHAQFILVLGGAKSFFDQVDVGLVDVVGRNEVHLELEESEELILALEDLLL